MRAYSPGGILSALASFHGQESAHRTSMQRLRPGLQGSLIPFAPPAFVPQCQSLPSGLPSPLVFFLISTDLTPTLGIPATHISDSSLIVLKAAPELSPGISPLAYKTTYVPFTPNNSEQRLHPTYYRGCWHVISRCLFSRYRQPPTRRWVSF